MDLQHAECFGQARDVQTGGEADQASGDMGDVPGDGCGSFRGDAAEGKSRVPQQAGGGLHKRGGERGQDSNPPTSSRPGQ